MTLDPRTPVLVGVGALTERPDDPAQACEPLEGMARAVEAAARDAGSKALLEKIDSIWTPRGFWAYSDPGRLLAARFGADRARTVVAEVGILQTTILGRAAAAIAAGRSEVAVIVGGEARDRETRLRRQGLEAQRTEQSDSEPDEILRPHAEIMGRVEIELGLVTPTIQYAMIDNALRFHEDQSLADHRAELAALWGDFNRVAVANPRAWNREPRTGEEIVTPSDDNRLLAFPYTKSLVSQWNVNQSGALVLCSLERARALGLDPKRFVYPLCVVDSEHMVTLSERAEMHRAPGFGLAGRRALEHAGLALDDVAHLELYSCFPAAVRVQQRELGLDRDRRATQTGGMTFGGGPLNNFVIQSWVAMVERLRTDPGSHGLVTAVSGLLTKQGVSLLGPEPSRPFVHDFVTDEAREAWRTVACEREATGRARVSAYTVSTARDAASGVILACDLDGGSRTLRVVADEDLAATAMREELCGREVELETGGGVRFL